MRAIFTLAILFALSTFASGQFSPEKAALSRMEKGKWKDAEKALRKALRKDSADAEVKYILSWYYDAPANPSANIDSAHFYAMSAQEDYSHSSLKERERLKRFPLDSIILARQRKKIDSNAFFRAKQINTEEGYIAYLTRFSRAEEVAVAIELRDEVAFLESLKLNTAAGFQEYIRKYPHSIRAAEANQRYEKLQYLDMTRDGKLRSYALFYQSYPLSAYRVEAERNIFEISTASGKVSAFFNFLNKYPSSKFRQRSLALVYHLMKDDERESGTLSDSLKQVQIQERGFWVPVFKNGKFGFMDQAGNETIKPGLDSIYKDYLCGNIHADYLIVSGGIINRSGSWIVRGAFDDVKELGAGFLKVTRGSCASIVHKSGWAMKEACYEDVKLLGRNFLAFRTNVKWGILSFTYKVLFEPQFDDVVAFDTLIVFSVNGKKSFATLDQVAGMADKDLFVPTLVFDDVQRLGHGSYRVRNGTLEGVLNDKLEFSIPLDRQTITITPVGFVLAVDLKYKVTGLPGIDEHTEFDQVQFYGAWAKLRSGKQLQLYNVYRHKPEAIAPDSLWFQNQLAFARHRDSVTVFLNSAGTVSYTLDSKISFIKSADSSRFFFVADKNQKMVFNAVTGRRMFSTRSDAVEYIGHDSFLVSLSGKKGIVHKDGKTLLPIEYAALVPLPGDWVSLLKNKKFGLYNIVTRKLVKPAYDRNVKPFSKKLLIAFKDGAWGFIDLEAHSKGAFEFDEIRLWNDTSALVRKNFQWMIYGVRSQKVTLGEIKDYRFILESPQETIAIVRRNNYYGVISNHRGEVIPAGFSEIVNVGNSDEPLFFTDKYVEEAGIHVVIYYDKNGKVLRKQALEENEYEKIICED